MPKMVWKMDQISGQVREKKSWTKMGTLSSLIYICFAAVMSSEACSPPFNVPSGAPDKHRDDVCCWR